MIKKKVRSQKPARQFALTELTQEFSERLFKSSPPSLESPSRIGLRMRCFRTFVATIDFRAITEKHSERMGPPMMDVGFALGGRFLVNNLKRRPRGFHTPRAARLLRISLI